MRKKKKLILRFAGIGTLHAVLYLVVVPVVILPLFTGVDSRLVFGVVGAFSVAVAVWILVRPFSNGRKNKTLKKSDEK